MTTAEKLQQNDDELVRIEARVNSLTEDVRRLEAEVSNLEKDKHQLKESISALEGVITVG